VIYLAYHFASVYFGFGIGSIPNIMPSFK